MKYLIASDGMSIEDNVSSNFLEAPYYLFYDDWLDRSEIISNTIEIDSFYILRKAAESGAGTLICGDIDPRSFVAAELSNLKVGISPMISARKANELASKRQLMIATAPTVRDRSSLS